MVEWIPHPCYLGYLEKITRSITIGFNYGQKHVVELESADEQNIDYLASKSLEVDYKIVDLSSLMSMFSGSLTLKRRFQRAIMKKNR